MECSESSFVSPEGPYALTEEHRPSPLHSAFNSSASAPQPGTATRVSTVTVNFPQVKSNTSQGFTSLLGGNRDKIDKRDAKKGSQQPTALSTLAVPPHDKDESVSSSDHAADDQALGGDANGHQQDGHDSQSSTTPLTTLFSPSFGPAGANKKKTGGRPKHSLRTTSSSFVTRLHTVEGLSKLLASKTGEATFVFYNSGRSLYWIEVGLKHKEPYARITFSAWPTCHAVNLSTASPGGLDVVIGFHTGDLIWFDPMSSRYARINKGGCITSAPCTSVAWVPGSANLFLVSHADGTIIVYDKEREDAVFTPNPIPTTSTVNGGLSVPAHHTPPYPSTSTSASNLTASAGAPPSPVALTAPYVIIDEKATGHLEGGSTDISSTFSASSSSQPSLHRPGAQDLSASIQEAWDPREEMIVTRPGAWYNDQNRGTSGDDGVAGKERERERLEREKEMSLVNSRNPVSHWRISRKSVTDFAFSSDIRFVAAISEDGCLRVIDALAEKLLDSYAAYFASLTCVGWSPDGRFILTGGQDDLITIFSPVEQRVIARCQGHSSFVSSIAFDTLRSDGRTYRFASVGEDCKVILWDFSGGALHRPRNVHHRTSISSQYSLVAQRYASLKDRSELHLASGGPAISRFHPAPSRNDVPIVQPVLVKQIDGEILSSLSFTPHSLMTVSRIGTIKVWVRPPPVARGSRARKGEGKGLHSNKANGPIVRVAG